MRPVRGLAGCRLFGAQMPVKKKNYLVGYRAENRARNELRSRGYLVVRSASSKGPFDLIGICVEHVLGVQIKVVPTGMVPSVEKLKVELAAVPAPKSMKIEIWLWEQERGWHYYQVN